MAEEIFDGCIASEMTLGEAMAKGVLSTPKYVMAMYSYGEELKKLKQRIQTMESRSSARKNMELLEQLRRALEKRTDLTKSLKSICAWKENTWQVHRILFQP